METEEAEAVSLGIEIDDPEDIATDGVMFYVVGSQSRRTDRGVDLIRFAYEPSTGRLTKIATLHGLGELLQRELLELDASSITPSRLNIEGVAWDTHARALLLGLRSPVVKGYALVIPLHLRESMDSSPLEADAAAPDSAPAERPGHSRVRRRRGNRPLPDPRWIRTARSVPSARAERSGFDRREGGAAVSLLA